MFHPLFRRAHRPGLRTAAILALPVLAVSCVHAQVLYGTLTGNVTDASNAAVPGATVIIKNINTGLTRTGTTDSSGNYQLTDVPQGNYTVTISGSGFGNFETTNVPIAVNQTKRIDAALTIGGVNQTVDVSTAAPALQTDRADVSYEISQRQVDQLPTSGSAGRNPENLFRLIPGVPPPQEMNSQAGNPGRNQAINANGVANTINNIKIDGAAVNYPWLQSEAAYIPPQDAIESVNVVTSSFNAEQGAAGGIAANFVVKSGTNRFHGGIWEYNSISQFNARNYFVRSSATPIVPKNIYNEYGGNIGGPIIKDKLFFFFNYNKTSLRQYKNGTQSVPLTQFRGGDFSALLRNPAAYGLTAAQAVIYDPLTGNPDGSGRTPFAGNIIPQNRLSAPALKMFSLIPTETSQAATANYAGGAILAFDRGTYDTKINWNPTDRTTFFGRYSLLRSNIVDPPYFGPAIGNTWDGGQPGTAPGNIKNIGLGATHTFSNNFLIDANAGVVRIDLAAQAPDVGTNLGLNLLGIPGTNGTTAFQSGLPGFVQSQGLSSFGNYLQSNPFSFRDYQYVGNLNATYIHGNHSYRFGGEYTHSAINHLQTNAAGPRGQFTFSGGVTSLNGGAGGAQTPNFARVIADNLLGLPNNVAKTVQLFQPNGPRWSEFGFFAQDTWKASANLTINYGVRYEYYPFATRDHTGVFRYDPTSGNTLIGGRGNVPTDTGVDVGKGQLVPRFGINYRVNDKTVIRSGAGITVDPENYRFYRDAYPALTTLSQTGVGTFTTQYTPAAALSATNGLTPAGTLPIGVPPVVLPDISSGVVPLPYNYGTVFSPQKWRRGYVETWNLFIDRDLAKGLVASIGYVGTHQVRQVAGRDINSGFVSNLGSNTRPIFANANATGGARRNVNTIYDFFPFGTVNYSGLQFSLNERTFKSIQFGYAFTWSHTLNTYDTNSTPGTVTFNSLPLFSRNYANSGFDRTFVNSLWTNYQLPIGPGRQFLSSGILGRIVGNFDLNTILLYDSGTPFQLTDSSTSGNGDTVVPYQFSKPTVNGVKYNGTNPNYPQYFVNNGSFATVTSVYGSGANLQNGNVGRNSLRGPGLFNLDLGISRNFPIWREYTFVLRGEAFDATNTPQWANPAANINSPGTFGQITGSNAARVLRLSGRFTF